MPAPTTSLTKPSAADRPGRRRRRIKVLLWRAALGAASATGAGLVTLAADRIAALF